MTKKEYIRRLRRALKGIPEREKDKLVDYYAEMIDESFERGKTQAEVFDDLESPEKVARDYFNANEGLIGGIYDEEYEAGYEDFVPRDSRRKRVRTAKRERIHSGRNVEHKPEKEGRNPVVTLLMIPFYIILFVLGLAALIVGITLVVATVVCVVAFFVSGIYCIVMSFGLIVSHGMIAASQIGAGFVLIGLSLLCGLLVAPVARGFGRFSGWMFRGGRASEKLRVERFHKQAIITASVAIAFVIAGGATSAIGFGKLGWDWKNCAVVGDVTEQTETISLLDMNAFDIVSDNLSLEVKSSKEQEAKLVYYTCEDLPRTYHYENGKVTIDSGSWSHSAKSYLKEVWNRGILFSTVMSVTQKAVLYLPDTYSGSLSVNVQNGSLKLEDVVLGAVSLSVNNGTLTVNRCVLTELTANNDNGMIKIDEVQSRAVNLKTDNGTISFDRIAADNLFLRVHNGAIGGSIVGVQTDYKIQASTKLGSCNLSDTVQGDKILTANVDCGSIRIRFVN